VPYENEDTANGENVLEEIRNKLPIVNIENKIPENIINNGNGIITTKLKLL
jgi:hypothetical protein